MIIDIIGYVIIMGSNFQANFKGFATGIKQYVTEMGSITMKQNQTAYFGTEEIDYGEAEDFDYESYLEQEEFDAEAFYQNQIEEATHFKELFEQTLEEAENEKSQLQNAYSEVMLVGFNESMYGLVSLDGYRYATVEEYIQYYQSLIDPNFCMDPETFSFSQEIYLQKLEEAEAKARAEYEDKFNRCFEEAMGMTYQEYEERLTQLNNDITTLESTKYALTQQLKEMPYSALFTTDVFQNYKSTHQSVNYNDIKEIVTDYIESLYSGSTGIGVANLSTVVNMIMGAFRFDLLSDDDKIMLQYLLENKGISEAQTYIIAIEDRLNRVAGEREAREFIESISVNGEIDANLLNGAKTAGKGLLDGIENFGEGILSLFKTEGMISQNQYAQMYILEALNESKIMSGTYQFSVSAGNMVPAMAVSTLVSAIATPGAGSIVGSSLMGLSAGGNAKNQALINGNSLVEAYVYGGLIGLSETTLGYFLGKMPGLSKTSGFTLKNLLLEGVEEFSQEWLQAGLQTAILNQNVDWSTIPEQSLSAFAMGFLMAGFFSGANKTINIVLHNITYTIDAETVFEYMEKNDAEIIESIEKTHRIRFDLATLTDEQLAEFVNSIQNLDSDSYFESVRTLKQNYGVDQGSFSNLKIENNQLYTRLREKVIDEYHFYPKDVDKLFTIIDSVGACNYARSVNVLIEEFRAKPLEFEKLFGFPLYTLDTNGKVVINGEELFLDLYIWGNLEVEEAELLQRDEFGKVVFNSAAYQVTSNGYRMVHQRGGAYNQVIDYLRSKSSLVKFENTLITSDEDSIDTIRSTLMANATKNLSMGYGPKTEVGVPMIEVSSGNIYPIRGGHWVKITAIQSDGIIVSSWGKKFLITYENLLYYGVFQIFTDELIYP